MSSLKDPRPGPGRRGHRRGGPVRSRAWELEIFTSLVVGEGARERHWDGGGEGPVPCPWWEGQTASLPEGLLCAGQGSCFPLHFGISPSERGSGSAAGGVVTALGLESRCQVGLMALLMGFRSSAQSLPTAGGRRR